MLRAALARRPARPANDVPRFDVFGRDEPRRLVELVTMEIAKIEDVNLESREITVDGHTGLEFTSESPAVNLKSQLFLIGKRMFQTATMVYKDVDQTTSVNRFFESLKFSTK